LLVAVRVVELMLELVAVAVVPVVIAQMFLVR
jgi:hypothetical protein